MPACWQTCFERGLAAFAATPHQIWDEMRIGEPLPIRLRTQNSLALSDPPHLLLPLTILQQGGHAGIVR